MLPCRWPQCASAVSSAKSSAAQNPEKGLGGSPEGGEGALQTLEQPGDGVVEDSLQLAQHVPDLLDQLVCSPQGHASAWLQPAPQACRGGHHLTQQGQQRETGDARQSPTLPHRCKAADQGLPAVTSADGRGAGSGQLQHTGQKRIRL